ncbi:MAG: tetratricopeptide repeat protein [Hyphomicrobiales bacterium]
MTTPSIAPPNVEYQRALKHYESGRLAEAEALIGNILRSHPKNADALNLLGVLHCRKGDLQAGARMFSSAISSSPAPGYYLNLAGALLDLGLPEDAIAACRAVLDARPAIPEARNFLGKALYELGRFDEAMIAYREALALRPGFAEVHNNIGIVLSHRRQIAEAIDAFHAAIKVDPSFANAHRNLGIMLAEVGRLDEAASALRIALKLKPDFIDTYSKLGNVLRELGKAAEARAVFQKALDLRPNSFSARWHLCASHLRPIYHSRDEIDMARADYERDLRALAQSWTEGSGAQLRQDADSIGEGQPFYLPYQGKNDRDLQRLYGGLVCRVMQARHPEFATRPPMRPVGPRTRIRVGIASGYFSRHSNWKIPIRGWVENLNKGEFELYGYHLGQKLDDITKVAEQSFERFVTGPMMKAERWARLIRDDDLHVLVFPEIGMDMTSLRLAALRLAPVQAASWGHPNTSGLPTIDYFLSSDLMEGPDADEHYTERLIRLPNLSIHYNPPAPASKLELRRERFGVRPDSTMYWCCQALFKYLPQYDEVFPRIATRVSNARFVFIQHAHSSAVTRVLQDRLSRVFARYGLSAKDHCIFLPHMSYEHFSAVARAADVFLDSIGWSGCNSTLECLNWDTPLVTLPERMMRSRHTGAIMTMMGVRDTIADSVDVYIDMAVRLGLDKEWHRSISDKIRSSKHKVIDDMESIRGLERFLRAVVT